MCVCKHMKTTFVPSIFAFRLLHLSANLFYFYGKHIHKPTELLLLFEQEHISTMQTNCKICFEKLFNARCDVTRCLCIRHKEVLFMSFPYEIAFFFKKNSNDHLFLFKHLNYFSICYVRRTHVHTNAQYDCEWNTFCKLFKIWKMLLEQRAKLMLFVCFYPARFDTVLLSLMKSDCLIFKIL